MGNQEQVLRRMAEDIQLRGLSPKSTTAGVTSPLDTFAAGFRPETLSHA